MDRNPPLSPEICYRINALDEVVEVNEAWCPFALENDGGDVVKDKVLGRSLWGFIDDDSTRRIYRMILKLVRQGRTATFPLRCDGPTCLRSLEMTIRPGEPPGDVEFLSRTLSVEKRDYVPLFDRRAARSEKLIRCCAWCMRIETGPNQWLEAHEAVRRQDLFASSALPGMTHGICPKCFEDMKAQIQALQALPA